LTVSKSRVILQNLKIPTLCEMEKDKEERANVRNEHKWNAWNCLWNRARIAQECSAGGFSNYV